MAVEQIGDCPKDDADCQRKFKDCDAEIITRIQDVRKNVAKDVKDLTKVSGWESSKAIASQWVVILGAFALVLLTQHWLAYVVAILLISGKQHALGVLMHDGTHWRLYENKRLNDTISDWLLAFPIMTTTNRYRAHHFEHHKFVNTKDDPYWDQYTKDEGWAWPKTVGGAIKTFFVDIIGLGALRNFNMLWEWSFLANHFNGADHPPKLSMGERLRLYAWIAFVAAVVLGTGIWFEFLVLWMIPVFTTMWMEIKMRTVAEHLGIENVSELNTTRHVDGHWLEKYFFAPCNINYHLAHHLFPSVPFYNLPKLHARLMQEEQYASHAHLKTSYLSLDPKKGVLGELLQLKKNAAAVE